ncbi:MAG: hypothetical protein U0989_10760 [Azonexus sp.]|nr:hypothetical protein [Erythrobacter sp.]MDZ4098071.1 hypothetical protein [Methylophilaceae bacterium]MDZ4273837.1 hypothetical protein [Erythrobacter sp.]MDZ4315228.1 hypothetical protein [Azonexus sp.]
MATLEATRLLIFSGGLAIFVSSLLGVAMLVPMQSWGQDLIKSINYKQIGAAHIDWIMLGLMQGLAGGAIIGFGVAPAQTAVWALIVGGWLNPTPYMFRAFGINAFAFEGGFIQRAAAAVGAASVAAIIYGWASILIACWARWP